MVTEADDVEPELVRLKVPSSTSVLHDYFENVVPNKHSNWRIIAYSSTKCIRYFHSNEKLDSYLHIEDEHHE